MELKIKCRQIEYILILFPFFELLTFEQLVGAHSSVKLWNFVLQVYSLLRIMLTIFAIFKIFRMKHNSYALYGISLFVIVENIVSILNGSMYVNYLVGSITIIGLVLNCMWMVRTSKIDFINACYYLFGFFCCAELISILIWPYGFLHAPDKAYAIYFLGSKNTGFFYYIVFIYFVTIRDLVRKGKPSNKILIWILCFICGSYLCDAASSTILFLFIFVYYFVWINFTWLSKIFNIRNIVPIIIIIAGVILLPSLRTILAPVLAFFGRNTTFTGRDILWLQAIRYFKMHPVIGNGINLDYILITGAEQNHAHSFYLDLLAKYGIFVLMIFIITTVVVLVKSNSHVLRNYTLLNNVIIGVILLHSIIDHLMIYNYVLVLISVEVLTVHTSSLLQNNLKE